MRSAFTRLICSIVEVEDQSGLLSETASFENSITQLILSEIHTIIPLFSAIPPVSPEIPAGDIHHYVEMIMETVFFITNASHDEKIKDMCFHLLVSGFESRSPPLVILPKLVEMVVMAGEEKEKEVAKILMGLLLDYKQSNVCNGIRNIFYCVIDFLADF